MTAFRPFDLEEWQSRYEQTVEINLADSGVVPLTLRELGALGPSAEAALAALPDLPLHYPEVNGTVGLRRRIAGLYEGVSPDGVSADRVLVTVGASEANAIAVDTLVGPGDEVIVIVPAYLQVAGLAANRGAVVRSVALDPERGWRLDPDVLARVVTPRTRLIAVTNPGNPTGTIFSAAEMDAIVAQARRANAWLLADEVYRGSEVDGIETPTFLGRYERTLSVNSLSKAYGLSGLRIGWIVAPADLLDALWRRHEYVAISAAASTMLVAEAVLAPDVRPHVLERTRSLIRAGLRVLAGWVEANADVVSLVMPEATALAFLRLAGSAGRHPAVAPPADSVAFATRLREEASVLVAPGAYFGAEGHVRLSHALDPAGLPAALDRLGALLRSPVS